MSILFSTQRSKPNQLRMTWRQKIIHILGQYTIQWLLLLAIIILSLANSNFRQLSNLTSILLQSSFVGIGASAMTLLIINGAFDLSVAGLLGLCGVVLAMLLPNFGLTGAILATLALGLLLGVINGLIVTKVRIPAFIATLGMMNIYLAIGFIITNAKVLPVTNQAFRSLATGNYLNIPTPFLAMILVYLACYGIIKYTPYGRYIRAVGSNEPASYVAGIAVDRVRIFAFALVGLFTALAGVFLTAYLSSAQAIMATGYELRVIAVVVVGGTSLKGGQGTMLGSFTGALFFTMISNALNMFGVGAYWQYVTVGVILITALGIEALRRRFMGLDRA